MKIILHYTTNFFLKKNSNYRKERKNMNEMNPNYDNRDYDNRDYRNYRDYRDDRNYRDYRDYRDYDRRGGRMNMRNYRNYREDYYEELEMAMEDMREQFRKLEDISEMAHNMQDKNMIMKIAQKEKENYMALKQIIDKEM